MSENQAYLSSNNGGKHHSLRAECKNCYGLCCVALPFAASKDFAIDKGAGVPCPNLETDYRCSIHNNLRNQGFQGCTVFDCFGAGQKVCQVTFSGNDWRTAAEIRKQMFEVFSIMRQLHEILWYLTEALTLTTSHQIHGDLQLALDETEKLTTRSPNYLMGFDVAAHRGVVNGLLLETSEFVRAEFAPHKKVNRRGADLIGARLKGADFRGANLRGAFLIAADLRRADLRFADLIGADFRDADLRGADLTGSIFLTQAQINATKGDSNTKIPASLIRPEHWSPKNI